MPKGQGNRSPSDSNQGNDEDKSNNQSNQMN